jgi:hypothetical protein
MLACELTPSNKQLQEHVIYLPRRHSVYASEPSATDNTDGKKKLQQHLQRCTVTERCERGDVQ